MTTSLLTTWRGVYSVARVNLTSPRHPHRAALLCSFRFGKKQGLSDCPTVLRVWYSSNHIVFVEGDVVIVVIRILPGCLWIIKWTRGHEKIEKPCYSELATKSLGTSPQKKETASFMTCFRSFFFATCFLSFRITKFAKFPIPRNLRRKHNFFEGQVCTIPQRLVQNNTCLNSSGSSSGRLNLVPFLFLGNFRACFKRHWIQLHDSPNPPKSQTHSEYWWIRLIPSVLSIFCQSEIFRTNLVQLQYFTRELTNCLMDSQHVSPKPRDPTRERLFTPGVTIEALARFAWRWVPSSRSLLRPFLFYQHPFCVDVEKDCIIQQLKNLRWKLENFGGFLINDLKSLELQPSN